MSNGWSCEDCRDRPPEGARYESSPCAKCREPPLLEESGHIIVHYDLREIPDSQQLSDVTSPRAAIMASALRAIATCTSDSAMSIAVVFCRLSGLTYTQIAAKLKTDKNTVKYHLHNAVRKRPSLSSFLAVEPSKYRRVKLNISHKDALEPHDLYTHWRIKLQSIKKQKGNLDVAREVA